MDKLEFDKRYKKITDDMGRLNRGKPVQDEHVKIQTILTGRDAVNFRFVTQLCDVGTEGDTIRNVISIGLTKTVCDVLSAKILHDIGIYKDMGGGQLEFPFMDNIGE